MLTADCDDNEVCVITEEISKSSEAMDMTPPHLSIHAISGTSNY